MKKKTYNLIGISRDELVMIRNLCGATAMGLKTIQKQNQDGTPENPKNRSKLTGNLYHFINNHGLFVGDHKFQKLLHEVIPAIRFEDPT